MENYLKTQWHPAFCSAFKLELHEDVNHLTYITEYNINSKPLQADMLVIKKPQNIQLKNQIGKLFKGHNIIEYKSPSDSINLDTFIKTIGYTCIYKAHEPRVDMIKLNDITLTFVRNNIPQKLFKWLKNKDFEIIEKFSGIFYITHKYCFPIQMIISGMLSKDQQHWLTLLRNDLNKEDIKRAISNIQQLHFKEDKDNADSVLQVAIKENSILFEELKKEDDNMCEALRKLMEPEITEELAKAKEKGLREGRAEGQLFNLFRLVQKNLLTKEIAANEAGLSVTDFIVQMTKHGYHIPE